MDLTDFRRAREYAAWLLLFAAVILLGIGIWMLLGLPGSSDGPSFVTVNTYCASEPAMTLLPVASVFATPSVVPVATAFEAVDELLVATGSVVVAVTVAVLASVPVNDDERAPETVMNGAA